MSWGSQSDPPKNGRDRLCGQPLGSNVGVVLHRLQTMWRAWRERRRRYQADRTLVKAGKNQDIPVDLGDSGRRAFKQPDDLGRLGGRTYDRGGR